MQKVAFWSLKGHLSENRRTAGVIRAHLGTATDRLQGHRLKAAQTMWQMCIKSLHTMPKKP